MKDITRRQLLVGSSAFLASHMFMPRFGIASSKKEKKIALYNVHTGEYLKETFVQNGDLVPEVMKMVETFLRDHRNNQTHTINPELIHLVSRLQEECQAPGLTTFDIVSGYRSPETNAMLRKRSTGVAKNSYHMKGCALDIKLPKHLQELKRLAISYKKGGVGYYPKSGFVHVDIRDKPAYWGPA